MEFISKYKRYIETVLWGLIILFAYQVFNSVNAPIKFNQVKNERYLKVIDKLKDIRNAQIAYKSVNGVYSDSFEGLIKFIDTAQYTLIQKRDSSYMKYDRVYRIDMLQEVVVIDTLGFASVKDSLFGNSDRYKSMAEVPAYLIHVNIPWSWEGHFYFVFEFILLSYCPKNQQDPFQYVFC